MMLGQKPIGVVAPNPGVSPEIEGAPASIPGGNDGTDKTKMSGTPVTSASVPPSVATDLTGAPQAGQMVQSVNTAPSDDDGGEAKPVPATDTDPKPTAPTDEERRAEAVAGSDRQIKTIQDWMEAEENRPETAEQRKKRERREKSKRIIAAVSDGISALSNLYFTSQYAPNMYNHEKGSMSKAVDDRIERLKAEREKKRDEYMNFAMKLGGLENERAKTLRELEAQQERQKLAREKAQREAEQHNWLAVLQPDKQREQAGKANKAEQDAITAQAEAENAPDLQKAKLDTEKARGEAQRASAINSLASAEAHNRSNVSEFSAWDEHGEEHKYSTKTAADTYAQQHGTYQETEVEETSTAKRKSGPRVTDMTTTKKKKSGYAARPAKKSPTAGGGGKKSPTS